MEKGAGLDLEEFEHLDLQSKRLEKRFIKTMETLSKQPEKSLWACSGNRAEAKAMYRLLANKKLKREEIIRSHRESTIQRMLESERTILAVQDTSSLNYDGQRKMEGIGFMGDNKARGINTHTCLAITSDGLVLGLLSQSSHTREKSGGQSRSHDSKKIRPLEEKESYRWVQTLEESTKYLPESVHIVTVCDREGDMYELFDDASQHNQSYFIRIVQNRKTVKNEKIVDEIRKKPCDGRIKTRIPQDSRRGLKEREAVLQIRYAVYEIKRPHILNQHKHLASTHEITLICKRGTKR